MLSTDGRAHLLCGTSGGCLRTLGSPNISVDFAVVTPNGSRLLVALSSGEVEVWCVASSERVRTIACHPGTLASVVFSPALSAVEIAPGIVTLSDNPARDTQL